MEEREKERERERERGKVNTTLCRQCISLHTLTLTIHTLTHCHTCTKLYICTEFNREQFSLKLSVIYTR